MFGALSSTWKDVVGSLNSSVRRAEHEQRPQCNLRDQGNTGVSDTLLLPLQFPRQPVNIVNLLTRQWSLNT